MVKVIHIVDNDDKDDDAHNDDDDEDEKLMHPFCSFEGVRFLLFLLWDFFDLQIFVVIRLAIVMILDFALMFR